MLNKTGQHGAHGLIDILRMKTISCWRSFLAVIF